MEAESGFNDAPTIILVLIFSTTTAATCPAPPPVVGNLLYQLVVGGTLGVLIGRLGAAALRHIALPATGLLPARHGRVRHRRLRRCRGGQRQRHHRRLPVRPGPRQRRAAPPRRHTRSFAEGRRLAGPDRPVRHARPARRPQRTTLRDPPGPRRRPGPAAGRPPPSPSSSVSSPSASPGASRCSSPGRACAARSPSCSPRSPSSPGSPVPARVLNIVFVLVVLFTLVQGPHPARRRPPPAADPLRRAARDPGRDRPARRPGRRPAHRGHSAGSRLHGVAVFELRLPPPTVLTLIVRDGVTVVPDRDTPCCAPATNSCSSPPPHTREVTERRLRAIGRRGRLARWLGEHGAPEPEPRPGTSARTTARAGQW